MICLRCHHRKFEYGHHPNFGNCCLCANCRRYIALTNVSPNEICNLYMGLISAEVKIMGIHPYDSINENWPFPIKNMQMWLLWKEKAIQRFGHIAIQKPKKPVPEQRVEHQLDIFEVQS